MQIKRWAVSLKEDHLIIWRLSVLLATALVKGPVCPECVSVLDYSSNIISIIGKLWCGGLSCNGSSVQSSRFLFLAKNSSPPTIFVSITNITDCPFNQYSVTQKDVLTDLRKVLTFKMVFYKTFSGISSKCVQYLTDLTQAPIKYKKYSPVLYNMTWHDTV